MYMWNNVYAEIIEANAEFRLRITALGLTFCRLMTAFGLCH